MVGWKRNDSGLYTRTGKRVRAEVFPDGELWVGRVYVDGGLVDLGEWDSREVALRNAFGGMKRACALRRHEESPPIVESTEQEAKDDDES